MAKVNRNELCPCGSGKKNKNCCGATSTTPAMSRGVLLALAPVVLLAGLGVYAAFSGTGEPREATAAPAAAAPVSTPAPLASGTAQPGVAQPPRPPRPGQVWSPEHNHFHDAAAANAPSPIQIDMNMSNPAVKAEGGAVRIDGKALAAAAGEMRMPGQPPGPAPEGKVWSTEHAHWHDRPAAPATVHLGTLNRPAQPVPPPNPAPAGKVWSAEHGHWHDAPPQ